MLFSGKGEKDNLFQVLEKCRSLVESKDQLEGHKTVKTLFHLIMVGGIGRPRNKETRWSYSRKVVNCAKVKSRGGARELLLPQSNGDEPGQMKS